MIWSDDKKKLKVLLYTFSELGRPTWLASHMIDVDSDGTWSGDLYKYTAPGTEGPVVGSVGLRLFPNDPTRMAVNWDWVNLGNINQSWQSECLASFIRVPPAYNRSADVSGEPSSELVPGPTYSGTRVNQLFSGFWNERGPTKPDVMPGLSLNILQPTFPISPMVSGQFVDFNVLLSFDASGEPVWLISEMSTPSCTGMPCLPPALTGSVGDLLYVQPDPVGYPKGIPVSACQQPTNSPNSCVSYQNVGTLSRNVTNSEGTQGDIKVTGLIDPPANRFNPSKPKQVLDSASFFPAKNTKTSLYKITKSTGIQPVQYSCRVKATAQTCDIWISWHASVGAPTPWRHNLDTGGYTRLSESSTGQTVDKLRPGDRVAYELWSGPGESESKPSGSVVDQSAEVRGYGVEATGNADSGSGQPAAIPRPSAFNPVFDPSLDLVGAVAGSFRVDESGSATYRIPLAVAPGAGGFAPTLALVYSSGGGMGYYGTGVTLDGTSSILPCRPGAEFGDTDPPSALASAFCLDGQRLLLQSGTHRAAGAVYRTEIESFEKVVLESVGSVSILGIATPAATFTFAVYGKDGSVRRYGGTSATVTSRCFDCGAGAAPVAVAWLQSTLSDAASNTLTYGYSPAGPDGERYLQSITYAGGSVTFNTTPGGGTDVSYAVLSTSGAGRARTQRSQIVDSIDVSSSEGFLRRYELAYQTPFSMGAGKAVRPRLSSIKECADALGTQCYRPTTFLWSDLERDPSTPSNWRSPKMQATQPSTASEKFPDLRSYKLGDFNGDRRSDLLWIDKHRTLKVSYSVPTSSGIRFSNPVDIVTLDNGDFSALWEVMDFDGDGIDDVLYAQKESFAWVWVYRPGQAGGGFGAPLTIISTLSIGGPPGDTSRGVIDSTTLSAASVMADFDGDGLPDLMYALPGEAYQVALLREGTSGKPYRFIGPYPVTFAHPGGTCDFANTRPNRHDAEQSGAIDLDGDGRADAHFFVAPSHPCAAVNPASASIAEPDAETGPTDANSPFALKTFRSEGVQTNGSFKFSMFDWLNVDLSLVFRNYKIDAASARARIVDLNGDGLADLLFRTDGDHNWKFVLAGSRTVSEAIGCRTVDARGDGGTSQGLDSGVQLADFDGDGRLDFWCPGPKSGNQSIPYSIYLWNGDRFVATPIISSFGSTEGPEWMRLNGDYDGDGIVDYMIIKATDGDGDPDGGWHARRTTSHHRPRGLVTKITNGFGAATDITYSPLTFSSVYRRDHSAPFTKVGRGSPVFDVAVPNYVVQYVKSSSPSSGNPNDQAIVRYAYRGLKIQAGGRGALGFRRVGAYDLQTGMYVDTTYSQNYPSVGVPLRTMTYYVPDFPVDSCLAASSGGAANSEDPQCMTRNPVCPAGLAAVCDDDIPTGGQLMRSVLDSWQYRVQPTSLQNDHLAPLGGVALPPVTASGSVRSNLFVAKTGSLTFNYDLATPGAVMGSESLSFDPSQFDDLGNPRRSVLAVTGGGVTQTTTSTFTYGNDVNSWKLGRLLTAQVVNERSTGARNARRSTFTYDDPTKPADVRKLLRSEKVEGLNANTLAVDNEAKTVVNYYAYDGYGNKTAIFTCSPEIPETTCRSLPSSHVFHPPEGGTGIMRYTRTLYDSQGRYAEASVESFSNGSDASIEWETGRVISRDAGGNPIEGIDQNFVTTKIRYGVMGRKRYEWSETGVSTKYDYAWCAGSVCPTGRALAYSQTVTTSGTPLVRTFYDTLGREVVRTSQGFGISDFVSVITEYDARGNVKRKSQPFLASNMTAGAATAAAGHSIHWTRTDYDSLNRPTFVANPDGGTVRIEYDKLVTKTILPRNKNGYSQETSQSRDGTGNVISTQDANGLLVTYGYDGYGALTSVSRNALTSRTTYDSLGRKKEVDDPDTKRWIYEVDGLGQVIKQVSPRGTCTRNRYDGRGRLWQRKDHTDAACAGAVDTLSEWEFDTSSYGVGKPARESVAVSGVSKIERTYEYNGFGQAIGVNTSLDGKVYRDQTSYDQYGRTFQTFFTAPNLPTTGELYEYNSTGYQHRVRSAYPATDSPIYYEASEMDAYGHVTSAYLTSRGRLLTERAYDPRTGRLTKILAGGGYTQNLSYDYDPVGNMAWRHDLTGVHGYGRTLKEEFDYDALQRLTGSVLTSGGLLPPSLTMGYDGEGNVTTKRNANDGANTFVYGDAPGQNGCTGVAGAVQPGPHAVTRAGSLKYCYDGNGNVLSGGREGGQFSYTPYDLPAEMKSLTNARKVRYEYGPNREKIRRLNFANLTATSTNDVVHYVGSAEVHWRPNGSVEARRYAGPVLVVQSAKTTGADYRIERQYLLTDALGSTFAVLTDWGQPVNAYASMSFEPFGARRDPILGHVPPWWASGLDEYLDASTRHGFTGHEQLDAFGVIHMGGRLYDPASGRFLQADPLVQDPLNSQSLNRYSYVLNNPMAYTDPTGYFSVGDVLKMAATVVISYYAPYLAAYFGGGVGGGLAAGAVSGFAIGAVQTGNLKGAVNGAVSGAVFGGINGAMPIRGEGALYEGGRLSTSGYAVRALSSGVAGGVLSTMQGGRFGAGFASAGLSSALTPVAQEATSNRFTQGVILTIVGGTASVAGGGKFANGAAYGAFSFAFGEAVKGAVEGRAMNERMAAAAYGDRSYWMADSVLFNDPHGAQLASNMYAGHVAVAVGSDDTGWYYYSSDGDRYVNSYFSKYSDMASSEVLSRYSRALYISGTADQNAAMQQYANSNFGREYRGWGYNCADYAFGILGSVWGASVDYTVGYSPVSIPNWRYEALRDNSGLGREFNPKGSRP